MPLRGPLRGEFGAVRFCHPGSGPAPHAVARIPVTSCSVEYGRVGIPSDCRFDASTPLAKTHAHLRDGHRSLRPSPMKIDWREPFNSAIIDAHLQWAAALSHVALPCGHDSAIASPSRTIVLQRTGTPLRPWR